MKGAEKMISEAGRERLSQRMQGNTLGLGKHHTEEAKARMSENRRKYPTAPGMKYCGSCKQLLPVDQFYKQSNSRDGLHAHCAACSSAKARRYYEDHRESQKEKARERNKHHEVKASKRNRNLKVNYGITADEYQALFEVQGGCCAICGVHQSSLKYKLYVDHNHKNGEVRGLLCKHCNSAIGLMNDDPQRLTEAIRYLEKYVSITETSDK